MIDQFYCISLKDPPFVIQATTIEVVVVDVCNFKGIEVSSPLNLSHPLGVVWIHVSHGKPQLIYAFLVQVYLETCQSNCRYPISGPQGLLKVVCQSFKFWMDFLTSPKRIIVCEG